MLTRSQAKKKRTLEKKKDELVEICSEGVRRREWYNPKNGYTAIVQQSCGDVVLIRNGRQCQWKFDWYTHDRRGKLRYDWHVDHPITRLVFGRFGRELWPRRPKGSSWFSMDVHLPDECSVTLTTTYTLFYKHGAQKRKRAVMAFFYHLWKARIVMRKRQRQWQAFLEKLLLPLLLPRCLLPLIGTIHDV